MSTFQIDYKPEGDKISVTLSGNINEDVMFDKYPLNGFRKISINMGGVKAINSCGIREWIKWFSNVSTTEIDFIACPRVMVEQFNMIDSVKPKTANIISFFVPYYSEEKNIEKNVLYEKGKNYDENGVKAESTINDDGVELEIDIIPNKYFQFLSKK